VLWPLLARELPANTKIESITDEGSHRIAVAVQLSDGQHLVVRLRLEKPPAPTLVLLPSLALFVALSTALSLWAGLRIVAPLSRFADAVDKFGLDGQEGPLAEEGPTEIRKATGAFNRMRERILRLIEDRTRMMMAISHDLRTPLTRLRLRAEDVSDPAFKRGILRDIDLMETSIAEAMSNLRDGGTQEPFELADLPSLVETICDQFSDAGVAVEYHGPDHVAGRVRPRALGRAITNLVENATKFGSAVVVRLSITGQDTAQIEVEDDGPGIADAEKEAVLKPFYRTDAARQEAGGFGLGLAIAHEVARGHKGSLTLHDREPTGLRVRLRFPLRQEADANL
jgi:signal transduction histidine kinase